MNEGWVKIHRSLCESAVFSDAEVLKLWIWLICNAAYEEHDIIYQGKVVRIKPGEIIVGRKMLSEKMRTTESKVYRTTKLLEELGNVNIKTNNRFSIVTIVNWAKYQDAQGEDEQQNEQPVNNTRTTDEQQTNNRRTQQKKEKKEKNVKKEKNKTRTHAREETPPPTPTLDEIRSFCFERESSVEPVRFYNFYSARGWEGVSDWKLKVEEWEQNEFSLKDRDRKKQLDLYQGKTDSDEETPIDFSEFDEAASGAPCGEFDLAQFFEN